MQQYVAFDVSKQSSEAVIVDEAGNRLVSRKVPTDPAAMAGVRGEGWCERCLSRLRGGAIVDLAFHEMKDAVLPVVCMDSWRARAALLARLNKTDRTNATGLDQRPPGL